MIKNCIICNNEFNSNLKWQVCCSNVCSKKYNIIQQKKKYNQEKKCLIKTCVWCNKEFKTSKLQQNKCSKECAKQYEVNRIKNASYYQKKELEKHKCKICNKEFITNKSYKWTCSKECQKIYQNKYQDNWNHKKNSLKEKTCLICKNIFNTYKSYQKLCSKKCYYIHRKLCNQDRFLNDSQYKMKISLCNGFRQRITKQGYNKLIKSYELLGCTLEEFNLYIEKQFRDGMTWENHGLYGWHYDHIIPVDSFNLSKEEEQRKCFHYTNYQPLWAHENLSKGCKIIEVKND